MLLYNLGITKDKHIDLKSEKKTSKMVIVIIPWVLGV